MRVENRRLDKKWKYIKCKLVEYIVKQLWEEKEIVENIKKVETYRIYTKKAKTVRKCKSCRIFIKKARTFKEKVDNAKK